jgi:hypothetical protein
MQAKGLLKQISQPMLAKCQPMLAKCQLMLAKYKKKRPRKRVLLKQMCLLKQMRSPKKRQTSKKRAGKKVRGEIWLSKDQEISAE